MSTDLFYSPCNSCKRRTRHSVLKEAVERGDRDYDYHASYSVIECLGCQTKSFRYLLKEIEHAYPDENGEWEVPEEVLYYPSYDPNHIELEDIFSTPELVRDIYSQSILAVQAGAFTLAGLGLRGTIEAVCNDRGITGRNLESRITKLATQGLIATKDAARLHAIRFLGNDAAHEIKKPSSEQISVALKIINHLIQSLYLLDLEISRKLDTMISNPEDLKSLLNKNLVDYKNGDEFPLAKFLGKDMRRLGGAASQLEAQLIGSIGSGDYNRLAVGKIDIFGDSKGPVQHFTVL